MFERFYRELVGQNRWPKVRVMAVLTSNFRYHLGEFRVAASRYTPTRTNVHLDVVGIGEMLVPQWMKGLMFELRFWFGFRVI